MTSRIATTLEELLCRCLRPRGSSTTAGQTQAILVIKLDSIGDFVVITPFLRELRRLHPRAHIALVTRQIVASLAQSCPWVDESVVLPVDSLPRRFGSLRRILRYARFLRSKLSRRHFDLAIIPRTGPDNHHARLLAFLSGTRTRIGFSGTPEPSPRCIALTHALPDPVEHEADANLRLITARGGTIHSSHLELACSPTDEQAINDLALKNSIDLTQPFVAFGVGASDTRRRWPVERYCELAAWFRRTHHLPVIILGDTDDRAAFESARSDLALFAGQISLPQSFALLRRARLFVGGDSGAMHLAAAAGVPSVIILPRPTPTPDPSDPGAFYRFHPHGVPYATACPESGDTPNAAASVSLVRTIATIEEFLSSLQKLPRPNPAAP